MKQCDDCVYENSGNLCCAAQRLRWACNDLLREMKKSQIPLCKELKEVKIDDQCYSFEAKTIK